MADERAERAFLQAIIASPDDDVPRLIYADWLDEQGQSERSEFVRVQCRIAEMDTLRSLPSGTAESWLWCEMCGGQWPWHRFRSRCRGPGCSLRRREYETSKRFCNWDWRQGIPQSIYATYRRGFVEEITCSAADTLAHLDAIRLRTPLRKVTLTTLPGVRYTGSNGDRWIDFVWPGSTSFKQWRERPRAERYTPEENTLWLLDQWFPGLTFTLPAPAVRAGR